MSREDLSNSANPPAEKRNRVMTLTERLSEFVAGLAFEDLPGELISKAKLFFLDWLGSAYGGAEAAPTRIVLDLASSAGGVSEATLLPGRSKGPALMAALVNGVASHVIEMDDLHRPSVLHPGTSILPAVLAAAEKEGCSGAQFLTGLVAGFETGIRVAVGVGSSHYRFWHTTGTCGTFGAAAGAGKLLGLDHRHLTWALGSAGTQAAGLWQFLNEGAMSKQLHAGKSAMNGLLAALIAQKGFTGAKGILEGEKGFFRATSHDFNETKVLEDLGGEYRCGENSLKYYASCGHTHSAIEAVLKALGDREVGTETIERIHVDTYQAALDLLGGVRATDPYQAKFCIPFCVATAVKHRKAGLSDFADERLNDPDLLSLMRKTTVTARKELSDMYPYKWPSQVEIRLSNGEKLSGYVEFPKGDPENPLREEECIDKFKELSAPVLSLGEAEQMISQVLSLEELNDVRQLGMPCGDGNVQQ